MEKSELDTYKSMTIENQVDALNAIVLLVNIAYKRGSFAMIEAAKAWDCLKMFAPPTPTALTNTTPPITPPVPPLESKPQVVKPPPTKQAFTPYIA